MRNKSEEKEYFQGTKVVVYNDDIGRALRKFKKKVQDSGVIQEYRARQQYEKPSTVRRKAKAAAVSRWKKKLREMNNN